MTIIVFFVLSFNYLNANELSSIWIKKVNQRIQKSIKENEIPGGVLAIGRKGKGILFQKAYGYRSLRPTHERATLHTLYDLASITKPLLTTTLTLKWLEKNNLNVQTKLKEVYPLVVDLPIGNSTFEMLLKHRSGLPSSLLERPVPFTPQNYIHQILKTNLETFAGEKFIYTDLGMILLGRWLEEVSQKSLEEMAINEIFDPIQMKSSFVGRKFKNKTCNDCAPTNVSGEYAQRGLTHDGAARLFGGIAGNAGIFSNVQDLSKWIEVILACGELRPSKLQVEQRLLLKKTVRSMIQISSSDKIDEIRGLGWDIDTEYSSPRGTQFPIGSFGHTGFTGPSVWIDPSSGIYWIFLTNRTHLENPINIKNLRKDLGTLIANSILLPPFVNQDKVRDFCE